MAFFENIKIRLRQKTTEKRRREKTRGSFTVSVLITGPPFILGGELGLDVPLTPGKHTDGWMDGQSSRDPL